jgi:hypothetical protein
MVQVAVVGCCYRREMPDMIGILITTSGILFLVVGLIGASIEVYAQQTVGLLQQLLSDVVQQQLPGIIQEQGEKATVGGDQGLPSLLVETHPYVSSYCASSFNKIPQKFL